MNDGIMVELRFFCTCVFWGVLLLIFYDGLRIIRRIIFHNGFFVALEDLIYWTISGLLIFHMMYQQNDGIIRGFAILAMLLGMILYHESVSELLVDAISGIFNKMTGFIWKVIKTVLRPLKYLLSIIKRIFVWIISKIKKFIFFLLKILKKIRKSSKISVSEKEEKI